MIDILAKHTSKVKSINKKEQHDRSTWPSLREYFTNAFSQKTRKEWTDIFTGTDACCVPVLTRDEAAVDGITPGASPDSVEDGDIIVPHPAPILSRTPGRAPHGSVLIDKEKDQGAELLLTPGEHSNEILSKWASLSDDAIRQLWKEGAVGGPDPPEERSSKL